MSKNMFRDCRVCGTLKVRRTGLGWDRRTGETTHMRDSPCSWERAAGAAHSSTVTKETHDRIKWLARPKQRWFWPEPPSFLRGTCYITLGPSTKGNWRAVCWKNHKGFPTGFLTMFGEPWCSQSSGGLLDCSPALGLPLRKVAATPRPGERLLRATWTRLHN